MALIYFRPPLTNTVSLKPQRDHNNSGRHFCHTSFPAPASFVSARRPPPTAGDDCGNGRERRRQSFLPSMSPFIRTPSPIAPLMCSSSASSISGGRCSFCTSAADRLHMGLSLALSFSLSLSVSYRVNLFFYG